MPFTTAPAHILWTGTFGRRVADHLTALTDWPSATADALGSRSAEWPHTALRVLALWRDEPTLLEGVARLHGVCRTTWLPVVQEFPLIRIGPLVVPGEGPCHSCYTRRRAQHERGREVTRALQESRAADPGHGIAGFTDAQAMIAAGLAVDLLTRYRTGDGAVPGQVTFYNMLSRSLFSDTVIGVHGCPECGPPVDPDDGWRRLADELPLTTGTAAGGER